MPEERNKKPGETTPSGASGARHASWIKIGAGIAVVALLAMVGLALLVRYLGDRPVDMTGLSVAAMEALTTSLEESGLAAEAIRVSEPALEKTDNGKMLWLYYTVEAQMPEYVSADALEKRVTEAMATRAVRVTREAESPSARTYRLALGDYAVMSLTLATPIPPENPVKDLTSQTDAAASVVEGMFARCELGPIAWARDAGAVQTGGGVSWRLVRFNAPVDGLMLVQGFASQLEPLLAGQDVTLRIRPESEGRSHVLSIVRDERVLVDITFSDGNDVLAPNRPAPAAFFSPSWDWTAPEILPGLDELPLESAGLSEEQLVGEKPAAETPKGPMRVAIILDDGGYGGPSTETVLQLDPKLTLSILPHTPYGADTAQRAAALGFEIMLHMPLQNGGHGTAFPGMARTTAAPEEIAQLTEEAIAMVPGLVGTNNHTGSRFTTDAKAMRLFLAVVKKHKLFFVDSRTSAKSVGRAVARELGILTAERDVFLDNKADPEYIKQQFALLVKQAQKQGSAIGICHFRPVTVGILGDLLRILKQERIELVHASELVG